MRKYTIAVIVILLFLLSASTVFATANPYVTIVNPVSGSTVYSNNLLVSVRMTAPVSVRVSVTQQVKVVDGNNVNISLAAYERADDSEIRSIPVGTTENFTSTNNLSFYTKQVQNVTPGVYRITVETINADGNVIHTNSSPVEIRAREENPANTAAAASQSSGTTQFLTNILRAIFGN